MFYTVKDTRGLPYYKKKTLNCPPQQLYSTEIEGLGETTTFFDEKGRAFGLFGKVGWVQSPDAKSKVPNHLNAALNKEALQLISLIVNDRFRHRKSDIMNAFFDKQKKDISMIVTAGRYPNLLELERKSTNDFANSRAIMRIFIEHDINKNPALLESMRKCLKWDLVVQSFVRFYDLPGFF